MKGDDWTMAHAARDAGVHPSLRSGCSGTFRVTTNDGKRPAVATCDECGASMGVRQRDLVEQPAEQGAMEW